MANDHDEANMEFVHQGCLKMLENGGQTSVFTRTHPAITGHATMAPGPGAVIPTQIVAPTGAPVVDMSTNHAAAVVTVCNSGSNRGRKRKVAVAAAEWTDNDPDLLQEVLHADASPFHGTRCISRAMLHGDPANPGKVVTWDSQPGTDNDSGF